MEKLIMTATDAAEDATFAAKFAAFSKTIFSRSAQDREMRTLNRARLRRAWADVAAGGRDPRDLERIAESDFGSSYKEPTERLFRVIERARDGRILRASDPFQHREWDGSVPLYLSPFRAMWGAWQVDVSSRWETPRGAGYDTGSLIKRPGVAPEATGSWNWLGAGGGMFGAAFGRGGLDYELRVG